jgi:hypothetical protein
MSDAVWSMEDKMSSCLLLIWAVGILPHSMDEWKNNHGGKPPPPVPAKQRADWLSWSLYLLLGMVLGAAVGFYVAMRMVRYGLIGPEQILYVVTGVALFGGAVSSYRSDRGWFPSSIFDPEEPDQSRGSRAASLITGAVGIVAVGVAVYRHEPTSTRSQPSAPASLLFLALFIYLVAHAMRTGATLGGVVERDDAPVRFWIYVAMLSSSAVYFLTRLFQWARKCQRAGFKRAFFAISYPAARASLRKSMQQTVMSPELWFCMDHFHGSCLLLISPRWSAQMKFWKAVLPIMAGIGFLSLFRGCGFLHEEKLTGNYSLIAVDTMDQMAVDYMHEGGVGHGRINETVFAVGWDERFIVAKQHPGNDRSVTHYYYLEMAKDRPYADPELSVSGPLTEAEFARHREDLKLPAFTRVIKALEWNDRLPKSLQRTARSRGVCFEWSTWRGSEQPLSSIVDLGPLDPPGMSPLAKSCFPIAVCFAVSSCAHDADGTNIYAVDAYRPFLEYPDRKPAPFFVPDEKTAIRIAEAVWTPIYGEKAVRSERPFRAALRGNTWWVGGKQRRQPRRPGLAMVGGFIEAAIDWRSGEVLRVVLVPPIIEKGTRVN